MRRYNWKALDFNWLLIGRANHFIELNFRSQGCFYKTRHRCQVRLFILSVYSLESLGSNFDDKPVAQNTASQDNGGWGDAQQGAQNGGLGGDAQDAQSGGGRGDAGQSNQWGADEGRASRPDFSGRRDRPPRADYREIHRITNENPEHTVQAVDNLLQTLQTVEVKLADKQADVNSPLYSAKTFEELGLDADLLKGLYAMKFVKPSKVQERALPLLLANPPQNMIAQSQSGTGKTAAFSLTMLSRVDPDLNAVQAVCVCPTRELARQILDVVKTMGQFTRVTADLALREEAGPRREPIASHIVIGTPGTILNLEGRRMLDLSQVRLFVLDEADVMLDKQGMGLQSMRVRNACPEDAQLVLFSATFSESVIEFAHRIIPNANEIALKRDELSVDAIKQFYMDCDSFAHKKQILSALYSLLTVGQSIVFIATKSAAEEIREQMTAEGHAVSLLHGDMTPEQRDHVIDEFRRGMTKVLLTTNVLARGIDVLQVSLVVNFDMPFTVDEDGQRYPDPETYLHRIGRTGRFGRFGVAINLVHDRRSMEAMLAIQDFFGREIVHIPTHDFELLESKLASLNTA